jgi:hypothetical protein
MPVVKPGYKTTELLATVVAALVPWIAQWAGTLSPKYAAIVTGIEGAAYAISRGLTKAGAYLGAAKTIPVAAPTVTPTVPAPPASTVEG